MFILLLLILISEVVYGSNTLTPLDILPLPSNEYANFDGKKKAALLENTPSKLII